MKPHRACSMWRGDEALRCRWQMKQRRGSRIAALVFTLAWKTRNRIRIMKMGTPRSLLRGEKEGYGIGDSFAAAAKHPVIPLDRRTRARTRVFADLFMA